MKPAIEFENIACTFLSNDGGKTEEYTAVRGVNLKIADGEFVSVVGPTGCGKSTLLNMSAGLLEPSEGSVRIFGEELNGINSKAGYMFQAESLMLWKTALENVASGLLFKGVSSEVAYKKASEWLARVGLEGFENRYPHHLSGGMRKRVAMAQTLIMDPAIILMDEPFSALDIQTRQLMENELLALWIAKKKAVLFITHDLDEAIAMSDRVIVMSAGPESHPIGEFTIDIERPRDVAEVRMTREFLKLHADIWAVLKNEVLNGYTQMQNKA